MVKVCLLSRCPAGISPDGISYAHNSTSDPNFGIICIAPGESIRVILHELAHIQTPDDGHGPVWRERMSALRLVE